jgi:hypothetical protein
MPRCLARVNSSSVGDRPVSKTRSPYRAAEQQEVDIGLVEALEAGLPGGDRPGGVVLEPRAFVPMAWISAGRLSRSSSGPRRTEGRNATSGRLEPFMRRATGCRFPANRCGVVPPGSSHRLEGAGRLRAGRNPVRKAGDELATRLVWLVSSSRIFLHGVRSSSSGDLYETVSPTQPADDGHHHSPLHQQPGVHHSGLAWSPGAALAITDDRRRRALRLTRIIPRTALQGATRSTRGRAGLMRPNAYGPSPASNRPATTPHNAPACPVSPRCHLPAEQR